MCGGGGSAAANSIGKKRFLPSKHPAHVGSEHSLDGGGGPSITIELWVDEESTGESSSDDGAGRVDAPRFVFAFRAITAQHDALQE